jgi:Xaa-Pro aminopeptidase
MFQTHRAALAERMSGGVLVLHAAREFVRNHDVFHEYRQGSDFYYLTGFEEPEAALVFAPGRAGFVLFVRPRNPERETWDGPRAGIEGALREFGADAAFPIEEFPARLADYLKDAPQVYHAFGQDRALDEIVFKALDALRVPERKGEASIPATFTNPQTLLGELRLTKHEEELERLRRAARITGEGHRRCMERAKPGTKEYELDAILRGVFREGGAERVGYEPIVGGGPNATILHYRAGTRPMQSGELCLIDAGAEFGLYTADVTRTFPIDKSFSQAQRAIYDLVLHAQESVIKAIKPGVTFPEINQLTQRVLTQGLVDLGLLQGEVNELIEKKEFRRFYMHGVGHWLGMDVHDECPYYRERQAIPFAPGMVLTVEPGLYIGAHDTSVDEKWRGIGVRIEDDIAVTAEGSENLTADIPKQVSEIEALRARA